MRDSDQLSDHSAQANFRCSVRACIPARLAHDDRRVCIGFGGSVCVMRKICRALLPASITVYMAKRDRSTRETCDRQPIGTWLKPWHKITISILLLLHLSAVVVAPLAVACDTGGSNSPAVAPLRRWLDPYITLMFLNHGYFFFAPDPGPSHLVDYKVEFNDGRQAVEGRFPDLATERPRLLYHRHFMLSESLYANFTPPEAPPEPSPPPLTASAEERTRHELDKAEHRRMVAAWQQRRKLYETLRVSVEEHLQAKYNGDKVTITRVEHRPPMPAEVSELKKPLNAPEFYTNLSENPTRPRP